MYGDIVTIDKPVLLDVTDVTVTQIHIVGDGKLVLLDVKEEPDRKVTITADGILLKVSNAIYEPSRGKTNNVVSDQVRHKSGCTVTEAG